MQHSEPILYFIAGIYAFTFLLIIYNIEIRWRFFRRILCLFGRHKYAEKQLGKMVKLHKCANCKKRKNTTNLTLIQGGKKDLGSDFKW